jgi:hypothetical protein
MEKTEYIESEDRLVVTTTYDATQAMEQAAILRSDKPVQIGANGRELVLAAVVPMEHIVALKNLGYDLLSPDPAEYRRALCYIQSEQSNFMAMEGNPFAMHRNKWQ